MHSKSTRAFTAVELTRLKQKLRLSADEIAWMLFPLGGLASAGFLAGKLLDWIASKAGLQTGSSLTYALLSVMGGLGLAGSIFMVSRFIRSTRSLRAEVRANTVEVLHVENAKAVRVGAPDDEVPVIVFDIGDDKLLCLLGQWMWDHTLFEPPEANDLFPADAFSVSILPKSGTVLTVQVAGEPLGQLREATLDEVGLGNRSIGEFGECTVFDGTLVLTIRKPGPEAQQQGRTRQ